MAIGDQKFAIRWAREQKTAKGRTIVVVTDKPVFWSSVAEAPRPSRAGPLRSRRPLQLLMDEVGLGSGSMAAAARVKPGGEAERDRSTSYADEPIKLVTVSRENPLMTTLG